MSDTFRDLTQQPEDSGWSSVTGGNYVCQNLESPSREALRQARGDRDKRPVSWLITNNSSNRRFKLLRFHPGSPHRDRLLRHFQMANGNSLLPELLWQDQNSLLFEFIEGRHPELDSIEFAAQLGRRLAELHRTQVGQRSRMEYLRRIYIHLSRLWMAGWLDFRIAWKILRLVVNAVPAQLPVTLDIGDLQAVNFIIDDQSNLRLIDVGSLRAQWAMGQEFVGDIHYSRINQQAFRDAYLGALDNDYIFSNTGVLRLAHLCAKASQTLTRLKRSKHPTERNHLIDDMQQRIRHLEETLNWESLNHVR